MLRANLSIDLDNKWAYLRTAKRPEWEEYPTYLPLVIPRIVSLLSTASLPATIFVVGKDLADDRNRKVIRQLFHAGFSLANHSFEHEPWLQRFDRYRLEQEICETHRMIVELTGRPPIGFRGPGFSDSPLVHEILLEMNYRYCASSFPSSVGPLARTYYLFRTGVARGEAQKEMFGGWRDAFRSNHPHPLIDSERKLWMFPVTTQPITRLPFHFTYLFFLGEKSPGLAKFYFRWSLYLCQLMKVEPSLLLHPLDFLGKEDEPDLSFFPGMNIAREEKLARLSWFLAYFQARFRVLSMEEHLLELERKPPLSSQTGTQGRLARKHD